MRLGLVGSSKSGVRGYEQIKNIILEHKLQATTIYSGGGTGTDTNVKNACTELNVPIIEFKPEVFGWEEFKKRNLQIAEACDKVISFALPYGTTIDTKTGEPIPKCYHCANAGKDNNHEKTAGCYTGKACGNYEVVIIN
jgi:hypothetical protein